MQVEAQRRIHMVEEKQAEEINNLEQSHLQSLRLLNEKWEEFMFNVEDQNIALEKTIYEKHKIEQEELKKAFESDISRPKGTPELLNLIEMNKKMITHLFSNFVFDGIA